MMVYMLKIKFQMESHWRHQKVNFLRSEWILSFLIVASLTWTPWSVHAKSNHSQNSDGTCNLLLSFPIKELNEIERRIWKKIVKSYSSPPKRSESLSRSKSEIGQELFRRELKAQFLDLEVNGQNLDHIWDLKTIRRFIHRFRGIEFLGDIPFDHDQQRHFWRHHCEDPSWTNTLESLGEAVIWLEKINVLKPFQTYVTPNILKMTPFPDRDKQNYLYKLSQFLIFQIKHTRQLNPFKPVQFRMPHEVQNEFSQNFGIEKKAEATAIIRKWELPHHWTLAAHHILLFENSWTPNILLRLQQIPWALKLRSKEREFIFCLFNYIAHTMQQPWATPLQIEVLDRTLQKLLAGDVPIKVRTGAGPGATDWIRIYVSKSHPYQKLVGDFEYLALHVLPHEVFHFLSQQHVEASPAYFTEEYSAWYVGFIGQHGRPPSLTEAALHALYLLRLTEDKNETTNGTKNAYNAYGEIFKSYEQNPAQYKNILSQFGFKNIDMHEVHSYDEFYFQLMEMKNPHSPAPIWDINPDHLVLRFENAFP